MQFSRVTKVADIVAVLQSNSHNGFPVGIVSCEISITVVMAFHSTNLLMFVDAKILDCTVPTVRILFISLIRYACF